MKIVEKLWFSSSTAHIMGIIVGEDEITKKRVAYIDVADGNNELLNAQFILDYGSPLPLGLAQRLVKALTVTEKKKSGK